MSICQPFALPPRQEKKMNQKLLIMFQAQKAFKYSTFKVSPHIIKATFLSSALICCLATIIIIGSRYVTAQNALLKNKLLKVTTDIHKAREEKTEAVSYKNWADTVIFKRLNFIDEMGIGCGREVKTIEKKRADHCIGNESNSLLAIEDLDINRINLSLDFDCSFKLVNKASPKKKQTGYLFVVASNKEMIPPIYEAWPQTNLINAKPVDYQKGSSFDIRYMKVVKARINQHEIGAKFNRLDVFAFSSGGELLLEKEFCIEKKLQHNPLE